MTGFKLRGSCSDFLWLYWFLSSYPHNRWERMLKPPRHDYGIMCFSFNSVTVCFMRFQAQSWGTYPLMSLMSSWWIYSFIIMKYFSQSLVIPCLEGVFPIQQADPVFLRLLLAVKINNHPFMFNLTRSWCDSYKCYLVRSCCASSSDKLWLLIGVDFHLPFYYLFSIHPLCFMVPLSFIHDYFWIIWIHFYYSVLIYVSAV